MANPAQSDPRSSRTAPTIPPARDRASAPPAGGGQVVTLVLAWLGVGLPLLWGVLQTLEKTLALFK